MTPGTSGVRLSPAVPPARPKPRNRSAYKPNNKPASTANRTSPTSSMCIHQAITTPTGWRMQPPQRRHSSTIERMQPSMTPFVSSRMQRLRAIHLPTEDATTATAPFLSLQPPPPQPHNRRRHARSNISLAEPPKQEDAMLPSRGGAIHLCPNATTTRLANPSRTAESKTTPTLSASCPAARRTRQPARAAALPPQATAARAVTLPPTRC